jgi:hypothetical protein
MGRLEAVCIADIANITAAGAAAPAPLKAKTAPAPDLDARGL